MKTFLVPVLVLVRQILEIGTDGLLAFLAPIGEQLFVAFDAERLLIAQNVPIAGQIQRTVETSEDSADIDRHRCTVHDVFTTRLYLKLTNFVSAHPRDTSSDY